LPTDDEGVQEGVDEEEYKEGAKGSPLAVRALNKVEQ
jgi:hypothetical protein